MIIPNKFWAKCSNGQSWNPWPRPDITDDYVNSQLEATKQEFNRPEYKIVGKKMKQSMLDALPKSIYAYRDGLINYGTLLFQRIYDEVNSPSDSDDW